MERRKKIIIEYVGIEHHAIKVWQTITQQVLYSEIQESKSFKRLQIKQNERNER